MLPSVRERTPVGTEPHSRRTTASGQLGQEAIPYLAGRAVALAGGLLEALTARDGQPPPPQLDETRPLEYAHGDRHRGASDPEHLGEKLMRHGKFVDPDPVVGQQ